MSKVYIIIILLFINENIIAQTDWAYQVGCNEIIFSASNSSEDITFDANGNSYVTGCFNGNTDFDNSSDEDLHTSHGQSDVFITKLNVLGEMLWTKTVGGSLSDFGYSIKIDQQGNVFVAGMFESIVDFNPDSEIEMRNSHGSYDAFLLKLDADGNFLWVNTFGGSDYDRCTSIVLDASSNVFLAGSFQNSVDFDQSANSAQYSCAGAFDAFLMKVDENGNFNWVKTIGGSLYDHGNSLAIDDAYNLYLTGEFVGAVDFDPSDSVFNMTCEISSRCYVLKLDSDGDFVWAKSFASDVVSVGYSISVSNDGEVFIAGGFQGILNCDPNSVNENDTVVCNGGWDMFVISLDSNGSYLWGKSIGSEDGDKVNSIFFDRNSMHVYLTGYTSQPTDFDPGSDQYILNAQYGAAFILKLDINGNFNFAKNIQDETGGSFGERIATDINGNIYLIGTFGGTSNFGINQTSIILSADDGSDAFVLKLGNTTGIEDEQQKSFSVYPNSFNSEVIIEHDYTNSINGTIVNAQGTIVSFFEATIGKTSLDLRNLPQGVYFVKMSESDKIVKLIKN
ncbi:MAG: T9SS type A sorting domain-containing protein [Flavobacteriia bacterium]|nr:T9SS type A sorting domain-containing protein [Flavobacteriia bacterium]